MSDRFTDSSNDGTKYTPATLVAGTIALWYDTEDTIPQGWSKADGTNGTINMDDYSWQTFDGIFATLLPSERTNIIFIQKD